MIATNGKEFSWKDKFEKRYSKNERDMMSGLQKDRAVKEILDEGIRQQGESIYKQNKKQNKEDKEISDAMGSMEGGGKTSEVEESVTKTPSKEINKGQSALKNPDEEEKDEGEKKEGEELKEEGEKKEGEGEKKEGEEKAEKSEGEAESKEAAPSAPAGRPGAPPAPQKKSHGHGGKGGHSHGKHVQVVSDQEADWETAKAAASDKSSTIETINVDGQEVPIDNENLATSYDDDSMSFVQTNESGIMEEIESNYISLESN